MSGEGTHHDATGVIRLTEWTSCGGCAAKWGASLLAGLVDDLPPGMDPSLLVGLAPFDDAAVYRLTDDLALVSTTDFFPPLVDDPSDFGAIAAANACSDVFAMGGRVVLAVNIAAFPEDPPNDAGYAEQWNLWGAQGIGLGTGPRTMSQVLTRSQGEGSVVAVVDSVVRCLPL